MKMVIYMGHPEGIATILSHVHLKEKYRVTFGSKDGNDFTVPKADDTQRHFKQSD
jgi:hypothetical protein